MSKVIARLTGPSMRTAARPAVEGLRDGLPFALAVLPFAVTVGVVIAEANVDQLAAWSGSFLLLAGSAQLAAVQLLDGGAGVAVAAGTAVAVNARLVVYGPGLAQWFETEPAWRRLALAFPIIDQTYIICDERFRRGDLDPAGRRHYYLGLVIPPAIVWVLAQTTGVLFGSVFRGTAELSFAAPLLFAGLLAQTTTTLDRTVAALAAGAAVLALAPVVGPAALGLGILAGIAPGRAAR